MSNPLKSIGKAVKKVFSGLAKVVKKIAPVLAVAAIVVGVGMMAYTAYAASAAGGLAATTGISTAGAAGAGLAGTYGIAAPAATGAASGGLLGAMTTGGAAANAAAANLMATTAGGVASGFAQTAAMAAASSGGVAYGLAGAAASGTPAMLSAPTVSQGLPAITDPIAKYTASVAPDAAPYVSDAVGATTSATGVPASIQAPAGGVTSPAVTEGATSTLGKAWGGIKTLGKEAYGFADKHPYLTGIALQTISAWLAEPPADPNEPPKQYGGITPEGDIIDVGGNRMKYAESSKASVPWKQRAGTMPTPTASAPTQQQTQVAQQGFPRQGLLNPPAAAPQTAPTTSMQPLAGGVQITGTRRG